MKHFQKVRRLTAAILTVVLLISAAPIALAASFSAYVTASSMAVYSDASLSKKLGSLGKYTVVTVKDYSGGVARISYNGKTGYAKVSAMKAVEEVAKEGYLTETAKVYQTASTSGGSAKVTAGTKVNVIAVNGGWALIEKDGVGAYIQTKYLSDTPYTAPIATVAPTATAAPEAIGEAVINANTKVYKKASTSSSATSVKKGMEVEVIATNDGWAYIRNGSGYAYIQTKYLSDPTEYMPIATATPVPTAAHGAIVKAVVNADTKVYKQASTSSASTAVKAGTEISVISASDGWAYIRNAGGTYAYIPLKYLANPAEYTPAATATPAPTAVPDAIGEAVINANTKVYKKASTSSSSASVKKGMEVEVIATSGSWAYIRSGSVYAYIQTKHLSDPNAATVAPTATPDLSEAIPGTVTAASMKVYKQPSTASTRLGTLKKGAEVNVIKTSGDWAYVELNGNYGYCKVASLTPTSQLTATPTVAPTATPDLSKAIPGTVTASSMKVYKQPSTASTHLGTLKKGAKVNVIKTSGDWAYVELNGNYGYCKVASLTPTSQLIVESEYKALDEAATAKLTSSAKVYEKATTASSVLGTLSKGAEVTVTAVTTDGKLARITLNGKTGWCAVSALEIVKTDPLKGYTKETFGATVVTRNAKIYESAGSGSSASIAFGTDVTVGAYNSSWAYVQYGSKYGFVAVSDLSRSSFAELSSGSTGSAVSTLEKALLGGGYFDGVPDSTYDGVTAAAVKRFQSACGLSQTGTATAGLQRALYSGNGEYSSLLSKTLSKGDSGDSVTRVQTRLYALGYLSKAASVDGDFGATTTAAVTLFQNANSVSATGTINAATMKALYSAGANRLPSGKAPADVASSGSNVSGGSQTNHSTSISSTLASTTSSYSSGMSSAQKLEYVIYVGQNQLGKPYVYGANGTSSYDCTGFTCYCFKQIGVSLPRTAVNQGYSDTYTKISSVSDLKRGDLVYFNTISDSDLSDHAGIYLGAGWFIHASSGQRKVVISTLSSGYYNRVFSWGRRVFA